LEHFYAQVEHARCLGFSTIYLFTPDRAAFYVRQGWIVLGQEQHCDKQVTLMKLEIDEQ
jgi:hypothetical protein